MALDISCLTALQKPDSINEAKLASLEFKSDDSSIRFIDEDNIHLLGETGGWVMAVDCESSITELIKVGDRVNNDGITSFSVLGRGYNPNDCTLVPNTSTGYNFSAKAKFYVGHADKKYWCDLLACLGQIFADVKAFIDGNLTDCAAIINCLKSTANANGTISRQMSSYMLGFDCAGTLKMVEDTTYNYSATYPDFPFGYADGDKTPSTPGGYWGRELIMPSFEAPDYCVGKKLRLIVQLDFRPDSTIQPTRLLNLYCSAKLKVNNSFGDIGGGYVGGGVAIISNTSTMFGGGDTGPTITFTGYYDIHPGVNEIKVYPQIYDPSNVSMGNHQFIVNSIVVRGEMIS